MEIEKARDRIQAIEKNITDLIRDFEKEYDMCINRVGLERTYALGDRFGYLCRVNFDIRL